MTEPKYSPDIRNSIIGAIGDYNTVTQNITQQPGQPSPHRLPPDIADFTGRIDYIQEIETLLQQGKIVAMNGMGGVGKSALAIHVAHRLTPQFPDAGLIHSRKAPQAGSLGLQKPSLPAQAITILRHLVRVDGLRSFSRTLQGVGFQENETAPQFPDAQLYVNLLGQSEFPLEPQQVLIQFLQALTGRDESQLPTDLDGLAGLYRSVLSNQKALIVLDNARDKLQIQPLLPGSASCGVIVTSRQPLGSLPGAELLQLGAMSPEEGLDYLKKQLKGRVEAELAAAQEIVDLCGRLPLALAIAGGALKEETTWTLMNYGARLRDEQRRLERLQLDDLSVRASFNLSYARLAETEQQLFAAAGWLPGVDFGEAVAAAVLEWETETTQETLRRLVRVRVLEGTEGERYQFHDLMRLFAREQLGETEEKTTLGRALDWYCENAGVWNNGLNPVDCRQLAQAWAAKSEYSPEAWEQALPRMALDWFEAEQGNWVAVMQQLQRLERGDGAVALAANLAFFFDRRSNWGDWVTTHEIAIACAEKAGNRAGVALTLNNLGNVYRQQGKWPEAIAAFEQSLQTKRELGDVHGVAQTLTNLGSVYRQQGKWPEAIAAFEQSLQTKRELGDIYGVAQTLTCLGLVYRQQGKWPEAIAAFEQSLQISHELGDVHGVAQTLTNLGLVYSDQGKWTEAIAAFEQSLPTFRDFGDVHCVTQTLIGLGLVYLQQEKWPEASAAFEQSLQAFRDLGDIYGVAQTLNNLGVVYRKQGKWTEAIASYEQSLQTKRELGDVHGVAQTLGNLGLVYSDQGKWTKAITAYEQCLQTNRELGDVHSVAKALTNLGIVYRDQGKWTETIAAFEQSLQISRQLGDICGVAQTLNNLGIVYRQQGKWTEAIAAYEQCLQIKRQLGDVHGVAQTLGNLGLVYAKQGKWTEAIAAFEQSLQISRQLGDVHRQGQTLANLGLLYKKRHQPDQAKALWQEALTKLNPSSPDFQKVQQWLTALNFMRWLIPLGIAVFLVACLLKGQWLLALGGVVVVGAMRWGGKLKLKGGL